MADFARNEHGLAKAVTFNVITPMGELRGLVRDQASVVFRQVKTTQQTAKDLAFLPFVHWVVVRRDQFPRLDAAQQPERLNYDYLFFLSTFNGPWGPYIEAFSDVLYKALDLVWFWSVGYPFARPVGPLKAYIQRNQVESDHSYSAYPGASVRDVRSALDLREMVTEPRRARAGSAGRRFHGRVSPAADRRSKQAWHVRPHAALGSEPAMANQNGKKYGFTGLFPIRKGADVAALREHLRKLDGKPNGSPLSEVRAIHMARFVVIDSLAYQGVPAKRDTLFVLVFAVPL